MGKWYEFKKMLVDKEIRLSIRNRILEANVRSVMMYGLSATVLSEAQLKKLESTWSGFLRRMVKNGFQRKNVNPNGDPSQYDYSYVTNNAKLHQITKAKSIRDFYNVQFLKFLAHTVRGQNNSTQKQMLFASKKKYSRSIWVRVKDLLGVEESQAQRVMLIRSEFQALLRRRFPEYFAREDA